MNYKNTGRYYWTTDFQKIVLNEECGSATIENVIFEDDLIQFYVNNPGKEDHLTRVNLIWDNIKRQFIDSSGEITAELFKNETKRFVYGVWRGETTNYTWWAISD